MSLRYSPIAIETRHVKTTRCGSCWELLNIHTVQHRGHISPSVPLSCQDTLRTWPSATCTHGTVPLRYCCSMLSSVVSVGSQAGQHTRECTGLSVPPLHDSQSAPSQTGQHRARWNGSCLWPMPSSTSRRRIFASLRIRNVSSRDSFCEWVAPGTVPGLVRVFWWDHRVTFQVFEVVASQGVDEFPGKQLSPPPLCPTWTWYHGHTALPLLAMLREWRRWHCV